MKYVELAKKIIINNLSTHITSEGIRDIFDINKGDLELLRQHIEALRNIFDKAIKELDKHC